MKPLRMHWIRVHHTLREIILPFQTRWKSAPQEESINLQATYRILSDKERATEIIDPKNHPALATTYVTTPVSKFELPIPDQFKI